MGVQTTVFKLANEFLPMSGSKPESDETWNEDRSRRLTKRIRGYLDRRRLPYVIEKEDGAIVLQLGGVAFRNACG